MSFNHTREIDRWRKHDPQRLTSVEWLVLRTLGEFANKDGLCWPSAESLIDRMRRARRTIFYALKQLEAQGVIRRQARRKGQRQTSNLYTIKLPTDRLLRAPSQGANAASQGATGTRSEQVSGCNRDTSQGATGTHESSYEPSGAPFAPAPCVSSARERGGAASSESPSTSEASQRARRPEGACAHGAHEPEEPQNPPAAHHEDDEHTRACSATRGHPAPGTQSASLTGRQPGAARAQHTRDLEDDHDHERPSDGTRHDAGRRERFLIENWQPTEIEWHQFSAVRPDLGIDVIKEQVARFVSWAHDKYVTNRPQCVSMCCGFLRQTFERKPVRKPKPAREPMPDSPGFNPVSPRQQAAHQRESRKRRPPPEPGMYAPVRQFVRGKWRLIKSNDKRSDDPPNPKPGPESYPFVTRPPTDSEIDEACAIYNTTKLSQWKPADRRMPEIRDKLAQRLVECSSLDRWRGFVRHIAQAEYMDREPTRSELCRKGILWFLDHLNFKWVVQNACGPRRGLGKLKPAPKPKPSPELPRSQQHELERLAERSGRTLEVVSAERVIVRYGGTIEIDGSTLAAASHLRRKVIEHRPVRGQTLH